MKKILLVQLRNNKKIAEQEFRCFRDALASVGADIERINLHDKKINLDELSKYGSVIVGGSHYSIHDLFPQKKDLIELIRRVIDAKIPFLGVCFGFEMLVAVCGGRVIHDAHNSEFGTYFVNLTKAGRGDKIFYDFPQKFYVQQGHEWRADRLPSNMEVLAVGDRVKYQAVKLKKAPIYGVQFHPELNKKDMIYRMRIYNKETKSYRFSQEQFNKLKNSPFGKRILVNFAEVALID